MSTATAKKPSLSSDAYTYLVSAERSEDCATASQVAYANLLLSLHKGDLICQRWIKPDGNQVATLSKKRCHQLINQLRRDPLTQRVAKSVKERTQALRERISERELLLKEIEWREDDDPEHEHEYKLVREKTETELAELREELAALEEMPPAPAQQDRSRSSRKAFPRLRRPAR